MKYSLTQSGILIAVVGTILVRFGFSEVCANEMVANVRLVVGGAISWYGRWRQGDITLGGFKKSDDIKL